MEYLHQKTIQVRFVDKQPVGTLSGTVFEPSCVLVSFPKLRSYHAIQESIAGFSYKRKRSLLARAANLVRVEGACNYTIMGITSTVRDRKKEMDHNETQGD
jgi:hypothetical protein